MPHSTLYILHYTWSASGAPRGVPSGTGTHMECPPGDRLRPGMVFGPGIWVAGSWAVETKYIYAIHKSNYIYIYINTIPVLYTHL